MSGKNKKSAEESTKSLPSGSGKVGKSSVKCKYKDLPQNPPLMLVQVVERAHPSHTFQGAIVTATGPSPATTALNQPTGADGIADFGQVAAGQYTVSFTLALGDAPNFAPSKPSWPMAVGPDRNLKTIAAEARNVVTPKLTLVSTDTEQYVEASSTETQHALHPYARTGALTADSPNLTLLPVSATAGELEAKKKVTLTAAAAGTFVVTLNLADPADPFVRLDQNPATVTVTKTTLTVVHAKDSAAIADMTLGLKLGGSPTTARSAVPPLVRWIVPAASELGSITYTDPDDYVWEWVETTSA